MVSVSISEGLGGQWSDPDGSPGSFPSALPTTTQDPGGSACMADLLWGLSNSLPDAPTRGNREAWSDPGDGSGGVT